MKIQIFAGNVETEEEIDVEVREEEPPFLKGSDFGYIGFKSCKSCQDS